MTASELGFGFSCSKKLILFTTFYLHFYLDNFQ